MKKLIIICFIFFFNCGSDLSYNEQIRDYEYNVQKADSLFKTEKYKESIIYSDAAIKVSDTLAIAIYLKGLASFKLNWFDIAEENFSKVIDIEGETSGAYKDRAKVFFKQKDNDFIDDIDDYLKFYPENEEAHELKRKYFEEQEEYDSAITEYSFTIEKHKDSVELYVKRSKLYYLNGDFDEALVDFDRILSLNPNNTEFLEKKKELISKMHKSDNTIILISILIISYIFYLLISIFLLKPLVFKKARNQIGGEFVILKDPIIWVLPMVLLTIFLVMYFIDYIPNFKYY